MFTGTRESLLPRNPSATAIEAATASVPKNPSTPRQPMRSPIRPDSDAPSRLPLIEPASVRPIATWRFSGPTRSLVRLSAIGNTPPAPMPARMRVANSSGNDVDSEPNMLAKPSSTRQITASRALPNKSAAAPSTGWMIAKVKANTEAKPAAVAMLTEKSLGDMRQHRIERAGRQARGKGRQRDDVEDRRQPRVPAARGVHHQSAGFFANASNAISRRTNPSNSRSGTMLGPSDGA